MEASGRPDIDQLPFPDEGGSVRVLDGRLVIERLTVSDERTARVVRERHAAGTPAPETVAKAIEIGSRVIDAEGAATNVDYVRRELESGLGELNRELAGTLEEGSTELSERLAATFGADRTDSVQQQIKEVVSEHLDKRVGELTTLLSSEDGSNPLVAIQVRATKAMLEAEERHRKELTEMRESHATQSRAMQEQIAGMRESLSRVFAKAEGEEELAAAEEAGTRKGRSFEERLHAAIERIASGRGDLAAHTGDLRGDGGTKKGDTVVDIGACEGPASGRIVFEAKDRKLSRNAMRSELDGALVEREADFAVLVVAGAERLPAGQEELTEFEGNKLAISVDPADPDALGLAIAYRYARLRVLMARDQSLEVDAAGVRDAAEAARSALKRAQKVRLALTGIDRSATSAREGVEAMIADVEAQLARIEGLVEAAADSAD
jgi:hypothetical protein